MDVRTVLCRAEQDPGPVGTQVELCRAKYDLPVLRVQATPSAKQVCLGEKYLVVFIYWDLGDAQFSDGTKRCFGLAEYGRIRLSLPISISTTRCVLLQPYFAPSKRGGSAATTHQAGSRRPGYRKIPIGTCGVPYVTRTLMF